MRGSEYAEMRAFAAVVRHGTFTRAAAHLGVSPSALSQTVRALEARLGARLLHRTTRSVAPTEAGLRLAGRLLPLIDALDGVAAAVAEPEGAPSGRLRINASRMAGLHVVAPLVAPFLLRHPRISLDLVLDDALVDVVAAGFDAGVRLGEVLERDMIAVRLGGELRMAVVASPGYLAAHGAPLRPDDLAGHACLGMLWPTDRSPYQWEFAREGEALRVAVAGPLTCDEPEVRLRAAAEGLGLAYVFEAEAAGLVAEGRLVRVLADWTPPFPGCFLYCPGRRHMPSALRAFIDFARSASPSASRGG